MNDEIVANLYQFWTYIGVQTNTLFKTADYKSVLIPNSDWPNKVFAVSNMTTALPEIIALSEQQRIPNLITVANSKGLKNNTSIIFKSKQKNMALPLDTTVSLDDYNQHIMQVTTEKDAVCFAETASESFGYRVSAETIYIISKDTSKVRLFLFKQDDEYLGCGMVFFDSNKNAGLHMIGTINKGRGKGIGNKITEKLISEALKNNCKNCVLHASRLGENIYKRLGFFSYGEIETFKT